LSGVTWLSPGHGKGGTAITGLAAERLAGNAGATASEADLCLAGSGRAQVLSQFEAEDVLAEHYGAVEAVAGALLEFGWLDARIISAFAGLRR
jgi:hypothetical protein